MDMIYFSQIEKEVEVPLGWYVIGQDEGTSCNDRYYNYSNARWEGVDGCGHSSGTPASRFGSACIRERKRFKNQVTIE
jgi:hypothetical protein